MLRYYIVYLLIFVMFYSESESQPKDLYNNSLEECIDNSANYDYIEKVVRYYEHQSKKRISSYLPTKNNKLINNSLELLSGSTYLDSLALRELYQTTNGLSWKRASGWGIKLPTPFKKWENVYFDDEDRVYKLTLGDNGLDGVIKESFGNLTHLQVLYIGNNDLRDKVPYTFSNINDLRILYMNDNKLVGSLPPGIWQKTMLEELYLSGNNFIGSVAKNISALKNLVLLNLGINSLTGSIPSEIGSLSKLRMLFLYSNQLTGNIPIEIGNLSNMEALILSNNHLTGIIPIEIGKLPNLQLLYLDKNELTGKIPLEICNLNKLLGLYLDHNHLSGIIPEEIGNLTLLKELYLNENQLQGAIPFGMRNLLSLQKISIANNLIDDGLDNLTSLFRDYVDITYNNIDFADLKKVKYMPKNFKYAPQNPIGKADKIVLNKGDSLHIEAGDEYTVGNIYSWYKDSILVDNQNSQLLSISKVDINDAGVYTCYVRNPMFKELTLYRRNLVLEVNENSLNITNDMDKYVVCEYSSIVIGGGIKVYKNGELQNDDDYYFQWEQITESKAGTIDDPSSKITTFKSGKIYDVSGETLEYDLTVVEKDNLSNKKSIHLFVNILKQPMATWKTIEKIEYNSPATIKITSNPNWIYKFYDNVNDTVESKRITKLDGELTWVTEPLTASTEFWLVAYRNDIENCYGMYNQIRFVVTSIDDASNNTLYQYSVYPNPATNNVSVVLNIGNNTELTNEDVKIVDIYGNIISDKNDIGIINMSNSNYQIVWNCSSITTGNYFMNVATTNRSIAIKLMVLH